MLAYTCMESVTDAECGGAYCREGLSLPSSICLRARNVPIDAYMSEAKNAASSL